MSIDYEKIKRLISLVEENRLTGLEVEEDGLSITIRAELSAPVTPSSMPVAQASTLIEVQACEAPEHLFEIASPMIGVFYRRPSPDSLPYVEVGDIIEAEQTVGLIEAMKVFSEVLSEVAGRVVAIPAENCKLVQQGDVLVVIDASEAES